MAILVAIQFYSPQSALVNRGVGGDMEGAGFDGAMGFFRPPGTFSFTNGVTLYYGVVASYVFYFWLNTKECNRLTLIAATASMLAAIPLSISRSLLSEVGLALLFSLIASGRSPKYLSKMLLTVVILFGALAILSTTSFFQVATEAFTHRFTTATENEGGIEGVFVDRFLGGLLGALYNSFEQPFFGFGLGMGTNVGSQLLTGGLFFLIAEGEWGRVIGELGPLLGLTVVFLRIGLTIKITKSCMLSLKRGDMLPWMMLSFGLLAVAQGGWAQPTSLGFSVFMGGIIIAAFNPSPVKEIQDQDTV